MQFTLRTTGRTPDGASRLVQAMSAWLVKPNVLRPGRVGMRGFMVITTMAMHKLSTPPAPPPDRGRRFPCLLSDGAPEPVNIAEIVGQSSLFFAT